MLRKQHSNLHFRLLDIQQIYNLELTDSVISPSDAVDVAVDVDVGVDVDVAVDIHLPKAITSLRLSTSSPLSI